MKFLYSMKIVSLGPMARPPPLPLRYDHRPLRRSTEQNISIHHRSELAKLEMEETRLWQALDTHKESWQATATCMGGLNRIHVRRTRLLGLDAPTKLDVRGIYKRALA